MNCPLCEHELKQKTVEGITVDVCEGGCGGIWFDNYELEKMDEPHETAGEVLLEIDQDSSISVDVDERRSCPVCSETVMMRHFFSIKRSVEVDECPSCGGVWLDAGELGAIRHQFNSDEDRNRAAHDYFEDLFGERMALLHQEGEEERKKARKMARAFRFICPSYYIPGKQGWGAF